MRHKAKGKNAAGHRSNIGDNKMTITAEQIRNIRQELDKLWPTSSTLAGNAELSMKKTIMALAPVWECMKKRGFGMTEIIGKLRDKGTAPRPAAKISAIAKQLGKMTGRRMFPAGGVPSARIHRLRKNKKNWENISPRIWVCVWQLDHSIYV